MVVAAAFCAALEKSVAEFDDDDSGDRGGAEGDKFAEYGFH